MLEIEESPLSRYQNDEHYNFHTDVNGLITSMLYSKYQEYYYILLISQLKTHYLCSQKVEEEIGSAGEQPISNKLSALYSKREGDGILLSLFSLYWYRFYGLRKPNFINSPEK